MRSERLLVEQIDYNLLFRWFVGLAMDDAVWDHSTFTKNRDRLLDVDIARKFFAPVLAQVRAADLLSDEHFSVDGTLIEAWASMKRFRPKDGGGNAPGPGRTASGTFVASGGTTIRTSRPIIRRRGCIASPPDGPRSCAI